MDALSPVSGAPALALASPGRPRSGPSRRPARTRAAARPLPELSQEHRHLSLDGLRAYRTALQHEEGRVSYWRRILQARLDVVREGRADGGARGLDAATLRPVLTSRRVGAGRDALVSVLPADDIPPLPNLGELWERRVEPDDEDGLGALEQDLAAAEQELSAYRSVLHRRLGEATGELIARYRAEPALCLSALPLPGRRVTRDEAGTP